MLKRFIVLFALVAGLFVDGWAQKDPKAKVILDAVSEKYQLLSGMKAVFEYYYYNDIDGASQTNTGEVSVKGNKYRLMLDDQEIYNNGQTVWTYIKSDNYKEVTINSVDPSQEELTPSSIYGLYKKGYNYKFLGEKTIAGKSVQEVELIAETSKAQFQRIKLLVDKEKKDLLSWEVSDKDGGTFKYEFKELDTSMNFGDNYFAFDPQKYPGVEVIDLR